MPRKHLLLTEDRKRRNRIASAKWRAKNPDKQKAASRRWQQANKERERLRMRAYLKTPSGKIALRKTNLKAKYGLTWEQYQGLLARQNGRCAICEGTNGEVDLCVDHCHATGNVRGLLCHLCNTGIARFKDDVRLMTRAIAYLDPMLLVGVWQRTA